MGFDWTGKDGYDYITCNIKLRKPNGDTRTLCLRGAFLTDGKTAAQETAALKDYCLGHGRNLLERWRAKLMEMSPEEEYTIPVAGARGRCALWQPIFRVSGRRLRRQLTLRGTTPTPWGSRTTRPRCWWATTSRC